MPLGWMIVVFRQAANRSSPAASKCSHGDRIAIWQTGLNGIDWLDQLKREGRADFLAYNGGYPYEYTAQARQLLPYIIDPKGPPHANRVWLRDPGDILLPTYIGHTQIDLDLAAECTPDEWLFVEAWDES